MAIMSYKNEVMDINDTSSGQESKICFSLSSRHCLTVCDNDSASSALITTSRLTLLLIILMQSIELGVGDDSLLYYNKVDIGRLTVYIFDVEDSVLLPLDTVLNVTYEVLHEYFSEEVFPAVFDQMSLSLTEQKGIYRNTTASSPLFHVIMNGVPQSTGNGEEQPHYGNQATLSGWIQLRGASESEIAVDQSQMKSIISSALNDTSRYLDSLQRLQDTEFDAVIEAYVGNYNDLPSAFDGNRTTAAPTGNPQRRNVPTKRPIIPPTSRPRTMPTSAPTVQPQSAKPSIIKVTTDNTNSNKPTAAQRQSQRFISSSPQKKKYTAPVTRVTQRPYNQQMPSSSSPKKQPHFNPYLASANPPLQKHNTIQRPTVAINGTNVSPNMKHPRYNPYSTPLQPTSQKHTVAANSANVSRPTKRPTTTPRTSRNSSLYSQAEMDPTLPPTSAENTTAQIDYKNSQTHSTNNSSINSTGRSGASNSSSLTANTNEKNVQTGMFTNRSLWIGTTSFSLLVALFVCCALRCWVKRRYDERQPKKLSSIDCENDESNIIPSKYDDESTHSSSNEKVPASWDDWGYTSSFEAEPEYPHASTLSSSPLAKVVRGEEMHPSDQFQPDFSKAAFDDAAMIHSSTGNETNNKNQHIMGRSTEKENFNQTSTTVEHCWVVPSNFVLESPPRAIEQNDHISYISSPGQSTLAFSIATATLEGSSATPDIPKKQRSLFRRSLLSQNDGAFPTAATSSTIVNPYYANDRYDFTSPRSQHLNTSTDSSHYLSSDQSSEMHPLDWSNGEVSTLGGSTSDLSDLQGKRIWDQYLAQHAALSSPHKHNMYGMANDPASLRNQTFFNLPPNNYGSPTSEASFTTGVSSTTIGSDVSRSKELIQDILWLEKKIADRSTTNLGTLATEDNFYDYCSEEDTTCTAVDENAMKGNNPRRELRCRDCFAPPGKLNIVIRSSADGPIVHTVDESSVLSGQLFKGDLIIAVDDADTRNMRAEAVMKLMHSKFDRERKITVLHFGQFTP
jgi:hypothetical protein